MMSFSGQTQYEAILMSKHLCRVTDLPEDLDVSYFKNETLARVRGNCDTKYETANPELVKDDIPLLIVLMQRGEVNLTGVECLDIVKFLDKYDNLLFTSLRAYGSVLVCKCKLFLRRFYCANDFPGVEKRIDFLEKYAENLPRIYARRLFYVAFAYGYRSATDPSCLLSYLKDGERIAANARRALIDLTWR
jgi:hypothetical protein